ncbi:MAG TPA: stage II sporulation protein M [Steroidobacteraceae bacterium]|nr:stage II sporulation protein M [Steroidobacteraceae bacterium]
MSDTATDAGLRSWLGRRVDTWKAIEGQLEGFSRGQKQDVDDVNAVIDGYRTLARDLSIARRVLPGSRATRFLESCYRRAHGLIARPAYSLTADLRRLFVVDVPATTRRLAPYLAAVTSLFVLSGAAGAWLISTYPELVTLFASEAMIETVESGKLWTDSLFNVVPSSIASGGIIANNISVTLFAYCVGVIFGLGTFYIVAVNGLMLGGIFAFTHGHGLSFRLFEFVVAHGPVELTTICLAGAAGMLLGESLIRPRGASRAESFAAAVSFTSRYVIFCAILLLGAGIIEGFVSLDPSYPFASRAVIGGASLFIAAAAATGILYRGRAQASAGQTRRRARIRS